MDAKTLIAIGGVLVGAGGILERFRRQGRDLNGVGKKQQLAQDDLGRFKRKVIVAMMSRADTQQERDWLAEHFRE